MVMTGISLVLFPPLILKRTFLPALDRLRTTTIYLGYIHIYSESKELIRYRT